MVPMSASYGNFNPAQYQQNPNQSMGQIGDRFAKVAADLPRLWREGERFQEERERFGAERERMQAERDTRSAEDAIGQHTAAQMREFANYLRGQGIDVGEVPAWQSRMKLADYYDLVGSQFEAAVSKYGPAVEKAAQAFGQLPETQKANEAVNGYLTATGTTGESIVAQMEQETAQEQQPDRFPPEQGGGGFLANAPQDFERIVQTPNRIANDDAVRREQWGDFEDPQSYTNHGGTSAAAPAAQQPQGMIEQRLSSQQPQPTEQPDRFAQYNQKLSGIETDIDTEIAALKSERGRLSKQQNLWQGAPWIGGNKSTARIRDEIKDIDAQIKDLRKDRIELAKAQKPEKPEKVDPYAEEKRQMAREKHSKYMSDTGAGGNTRLDTTPIITRATNAQNKADAMQQAIIALEKSNVQNPILNADNDPTNGTLAEFYGQNVSTLKKMMDDKIGEVLSARGELRDLGTPEAQSYIRNSQTLMNDKLERIVSMAVTQNESLQTITDRYNLSDAERSRVTELYSSKQKQKTRSSQMADMQKYKSEVNVAANGVDAKRTDSVAVRAKKVMDAKKKYGWTDAFTKDVMAALSE